MRLFSSDLNFFIFVCVRWFELATVYVGGSCMCMCVCCAVVHSLLDTRLHLPFLQHMFWGGFSQRRVLRKLYVMFYQHLSGPVVVAPVVPSEFEPECIYPYIVQLEYVSESS